MASGAEEARALRPTVRREVLRQVFAPTRVITARLLLYYLPRLRGVRRPWVSTRNAIASLQKDGSIIPVDVDDVTWFHLPRAQRAKVDAAREQKVPVYKAAWAAWRVEGWASASGEALSQAAIRDRTQGRRGALVEFIC